MNDVLLLSKIQEAKTNHLLHLILSILSVGIWTPVWILVTVSNNLERRRLGRMLK